VGVKIPIRILDQAFEVQAEDSLLRALQMFGVARNMPDYGFTRFCWNAKCKQCILEYVCDGQPATDFACQTQCRPDMQVRTLPHVLMWKLKVKSEA
jgi:hypothetical protein